MVADVKVEDQQSCDGSCKVVITMQRYMSILCFLQLSVKPYNDTQCAKTALLQSSLWCWVRWDFIKGYTFLFSAMNAQYVFELRLIHSFHSFTDLQTLLKLL